MPMAQEMEASGFWLFRKRSYLPFLTVVLVAAAVVDFRYPFGSRRWGEIWGLFCLAVAAQGLIVRVMTVGFTPDRTSGRNTRELVARTLNTTGMYSTVRNPLYLGNFLCGLGPALFLGVWWVAVIYSLLFMVYYERIIFAEEAFLTRQFSEVYTAWAGATPAFLPRFSQWKSPALPFNWRKVLRKENQTLFGIVVVFYILETAGEWTLGHELFRNRVWNIILAVTLAVFVLARGVNRFTRLLKRVDRAPADQPAQG